MSRRRVAIGLLVGLGLALLWTFRPRATAPAAPAADRRASPRPEPAPAPRPAAANAVRADDAVAPTGAEPGASEVWCPIVMADPVEGEVQVTQDLIPPSPDVTAHTMGAAVVRGDRLIFHEAEGSPRRGTVEVPGYLEADLVWSARSDGGFDCPAVHLRQAAVVVGTVHPPPRDGWGGSVFVRGCDAFATVAADGTFYLEGAPEPCELRAERTDGWYRLESDAVRVVPRLGEEVDVHLELPEALQAGLGIRTEATDLGVRVTAVRTGSAAAAAGLGPGDVILAVDGTDAAGLDVKEFGALARGDVGSTVEIEVLVDGVRERRSLTRTFVRSENVRVEIAGGFEMRPDPDAWVR